MLIKKGELHMTNEYRAILRLINTTDLLDEETLKYLRDMWTTYCKHEDLQVDTFQYDTELLAMWLLVEDKTGDMTIDDFNNFMSENLV